MLKTSIIRTGYNDRNLVENNTLSKSGTFLKDVRKIAKLCIV